MSGMLLDPMAKARRVVESHVEQIRELAPGDAPGFVHPEEDPPEACALLLQALALADIAESQRMLAERLIEKTPDWLILQEAERRGMVPEREEVSVEDLCGEAVDKSPDLTGDDGEG